MLPGEGDLLHLQDDARTTCDRKRILFKSFPEMWQLKFQRNHGHPDSEGVTEDDIEQYMMSMKRIADQHKIAKDRRHTQDSRMQ